MSYRLFSLLERAAAKPHRCIWCGEPILKAERHFEERSVFDGRMQHCRWHPECRQDAEDGWANGDDEEFMPHSYERPPSAAELEYRSWDCAALAQRSLPGELDAAIDAARAKKEQP